MPLDTLSGWPVAPDPTVLQSLGLLIGFPLLAIIVVYAIAKIGNVAQAGRGVPEEVHESVWVGGRQQGELESAPPSADSGDEANPVGGAGARW